LERKFRNDRNCYQSSVVKDRNYSNYNNFCPSLCTTESLRPSLCTTESLRPSLCTTESLCPFLCRTECSYVFSCARLSAATRSLHPCEQMLKAERCAIRRQGSIDCKTTDAESQGNGARIDGRRVARAKVLKTLPNR